jgi:hypothetical protein
MPNLVKSILNSLVQSNFSAAEVAAVARVFVAVSLQNLASQRVIITGIVFGSFFTAFADRANCILKLIIQRGLTVTPDTQIAFAEIVDEQIFNYLPDGGGDEMSQVLNFIPGISLDPGYNYSVVLEIIPRAAFAGNTSLTLTVLGQQLTEGQTSIQYALR